MSALVDHQVTQGTPDAGAPNAGTGATTAGQNSYNGNSLMRDSAAPLALAMTLLYQIMHLYAEVTQLDAQQKKNSIKTQAEEARAQADATIAGGEALKHYASIAGWAQILGAAFTYASALGLEFVSARGAKAAVNDINENELKPMNAMEKEMANLQPKGGFGDEDNPVGLKGSAKALKQEFDKGNYSNAIDKKGNLNTETKEALREMYKTPEEFSAFRKDFNEKFVRKTQEANTRAQKLNNALMGSQMWSQVAGAIGPAISTMKQAEGQYYKSLEDANAGLASTAGQMASATSQDFGQGMNKAGEAQNAEVTQVMAKFEQAGAPNAG